VQHGRSHVGPAVQAHSEGEALGKVLKTSLAFGFIEAQKALMDELFEGKAPVLKNEKCRHSTMKVDQQGPTAACRIGPWQLTWAVCPTACPPPALVYTAPRLFELALLLPGLLAALPAVGRLFAAAGALSCSVMNMR
jgi:hypothetical protein